MLYSHTQNILQAAATTVQRRARRQVSIILKQKDAKESRLSQ